MTEQDSKPSRWSSHISLRWPLAGIAAMIGLEVVFSYLKIPEYILPTFFSIGALGLAAMMNWSLHGRAWFWITMLGFSAIHVPFVVWLAKSMNPRSHIPGRGVAAFALAEAGIITAIIRMPGWIKDVYSPYTGPEPERKDCP